MTEHGIYQSFRPFADWADIPIDSAWDIYHSRLQEAKEHEDIAAYSDAVVIAVRSAAVETGAIEGLYATSRGVTHTVALQAATWERQLHELGDDAPGHFQAQLAGFEMVLDLATSAVPLSEAAIREIHRTICSAQRTHRVYTPVGWQDQPLSLGEYKTQPNNVELSDGTTHWYAPVAEVPAEMHRLVEELNAPAFANGHPILQAAYAHHAFTAIHPFSDGNGRTARALSSLFLYRAAGIPLVIYSDQQERYWDALEQADGGRPERFVRFIQDRAIDTLILVTDSLYDSSSPLEGQAERLRKLFIVEEGFTESEIQSMGERLAQTIRARTVDRLSTLNLGPDLLVSQGREVSSGGTNFGHPYRDIANRMLDRIYLSAPNLEVNVEATIIVGRAIDQNESRTFIVIDANRPTTTPLLIRASHLHPSLTAAAESQVDGWVNRLVRSLLTHMETRTIARQEEILRSERGW